MDTKNNAIHVNPKHKWCMKKNKILVKNLETENFLVSIDQASIKYQSSQAEASFQNLENFNWLKNRFGRSRLWKTEFFEKPEIFLQKKFSKNFSWHVMHENDSKNFSKTHNL